MNQSTHELLDQVKSALERFVIFPDESQTIALALWVLHTHVFDEFDATPYLSVSSPSKQAGKTRLFEVLNALVARPWSVVGVTEAVLFRNIDARTPTLLLDEIDASFGKDPKLTEGIRALLNAGYRRGGSVPRCVGPAFDLKDFSVYCPKAFAGIGDKLPDTIRDRAIPIELLRRLPNDPKPDRLRQVTIESELKPIGLQITNWAEANRGQLSRARPLLPDDLSDRQQDAWEVLFAIAELAGGDWPDLARRAAIALHGQTTDQDESVLLLKHILELFNEEGVDAITTKEILNALIDRGDDSPWARLWGDDMSREQIRGPGSRLARLLKPYGITPRTIRVEEQTAKGYHRADFSDSWARYLPDKGPPSLSRSGMNVTPSQCWSHLVFGYRAIREEPLREQDGYVVSSPSPLKSDEITISHDAPLVKRRADVIDDASTAESSSSTQYRCVSCAAPVTPASRSIENGWATVCEPCRRTRK